MLLGAWMVVVFGRGEDHMHRPDIVRVEWLDKVGTIRRDSLALRVPTRLEEAGIERHATLAPTVVAVLKATGVGAVPLVIARARM